MCRFNCAVGVQPSRHLPRFQETRKAMLNYLHLLIIINNELYRSGQIAATPPLEPGPDRHFHGWRCTCLRPPQMQMHSATTCPIPCCIYTVCVCSSPLCCSPSLSLSLSVPLSLALSRGCPPEIWPLEDLPRKLGAKAVFQLTTLEVSTESGQISN